MEEMEGKNLTAKFADLSDLEDQKVQVEMARATTSAKGRQLTDEDEMNEPEGQLTIDVWQDANAIYIESAVAGVEPDQIDINVTADSVSIRGNRRREKTVKDDDYLYQECYWGRFSRSVILPQEVDPEHAAASFRNGILTVKLPKLAKQKTKKLKVQMG